MKLLIWILKHFGYQNLGMPSNNLVKSIFADSFINEITLYTMHTTVSHTSSDFPSQSHLKPRFDSETNETVIIINEKECESESDSDDGGPVIVDSKVVTSNYNPNVPIVKPLHERNALEFSAILFGGSLLAFNAGFINACTYLFATLPEPSSHVTGTTTGAALALQSAHFDSFAVHLAMIVCYAFGSAITGALMPEDSFRLGREYGPLFIIGSILFLISFLCSFNTSTAAFYIYFSTMGCGNVIDSCSFT